jgi:hypothetical protein
MKISELLCAGKARIVAQGWCQGDEEAIFGKAGKCCAATALDPGEHYPADRIMAALGVLKAAAGVNPGTGMASWNDAPERTLAEVLAAYDLAIAYAKDQEQQQEPQP